MGFQRFEDKTEHKVLVIMRGLMFPFHGPLESKTLDRYCWK